MNYEKVVERANNELEYAKKYDVYAMVDLTTLELLLEYIEVLKKGLK